MSPSTPKSWEFVSPYRLAYCQFHRLCLLPPLLPPVTPLFAVPDSIPVAAFLIVVGAPICAPDTIFLLSPLLILLAEFTFPGTVCLYIKSISSLSGAVRAACVTPCWSYLPCRPRPCLPCRVFPRAVRISRAVRDCRAVRYPVLAASPVASVPAVPCVSRAVGGVISPVPCRALSPCRDRRLRRVRRCPEPPRRQSDAVCPADRRCSAPCSATDLRPRESPPRPRPGPVRPVTRPGDR